MDSPFGGYRPHPLIRRWHPPPDAAAWKREGFLDRLLPPSLALIGPSHFWLAMLCLSIFGFETSGFQPVMPLTLEQGDAGLLAQALQHVDHAFCQASQWWWPALAGGSWPCSSAIFELGQTTFITLNQRLVQHTGGARLRRSKCIVA